MVVLRVLLTAALTLTGVGALGHVAAAPGVALAVPAGEEPGGGEVVLDEVAVAVPPVEAGVAADVPPADGSGESDLSVTADGVVGDTVTTDVVETAGFQVVGLTWPEAADVDGLRPEVRVRTDGTWSEWVEVEASDDGPDAGSADAASSARSGSDPVFVGEADAVQARFAATQEGGPDGLALALVDSARSPQEADDAPSVSSEQPPPAPSEATTGPVDESLVVRPAAYTVPAARATRTSDIPAAVPRTAPRPTIVTRAQWGADESLRAVNPGCERPEYASTLVGAAIHHTASSNGYSSVAEAMSAIRGIQAYHVLGRGWCDIGYNFLVDRWGTIYEGRLGGVDQAVIGVHTGGFNTRTVGISMLGDYSTVAPTAAMREAVARVVGWRLGAYHRDPTGTMTYYTYGGENSKIPANTSLTLPVVFPHRQVAYTSCPGEAGNAALSWIRYRAAQVIGTSLVNPGFPSSTVDRGAGVDLWGGAWGHVAWRLSMTDARDVPVWEASGTVANGVVHARWSGRDAGGTPYPAGTYDVSLTATDVATGAALVPYTATLTVAAPVNPFGQLDAVTTAPGRVTAGGWAVDPETSSPIIVQMYVDGSANTMVWADRDRPDVGAAYPASGSRHGYELSLAAAAGPHTVCVYAVNTGRGASQELGCRRVVVPSSSPVGQVDRLSTTGGVVRAAGWTVDPDTSGPVIVQMWVDGRTYTMGWADQRRDDVGRALPWAGADHGYELALPATPGYHLVCVIAVNTGAGSSVELGCRWVAVP